MRPGSSTASDPVATPAIKALPSRVPLVVMIRTAPARNPGYFGAKTTLAVQVCPTTVTG